MKKSKHTLSYSVNYTLTEMTQTKTQKDKEPTTMDMRDKKKNKISIQK